MGKYAALRVHLRHLDEDIVTLSFDVLNDLIPGGLPPSAYRYDAWWSNEDGDTRHVQSADGWMAAGYVVSRIDRTAGVVKLRRAAT